jgi:excisionase family DNA binding protein
MATERAMMPDSGAQGVHHRRQPAEAPLRPLLTIGQVASVLGVSPKTVRRLVARGFPHIRFGRVLRFDPVDVQRWLEARRS